ncbi:ATP-binding protein [Streptomyces flavidovirens]|uniref:ATP-binding protein n=1 Tax=Streptomyces flavidovirens TaxID=67298 RepID=UPI00342CF2FB
MNNETGATPHEPAVTADDLSFSSLFPTTRRGAHAVRHTAERWLAAHLPPEQDAASSSLIDTATLLVAELAANAALHGRVRGRSARLALALTEDAKELLIEVTDPRGDRLPAQHAPTEGESGRGLLLIEALADDWGVQPHHPGGKTVWALCRR